MNTKHFEYAVAIEETGSLSRAAGRLKVSQPVLSRFLVKEEALLGVPLFERLENKYIPTEAGRIYLYYGRKILSQQDQALHAIHQLLGTDIKTIRIGLTPHHGGRVIAKIYTQLLHPFPNVRLETEEAYSQTLLESLQAGRTSIMLNFYEPQLLPDTKAMTFGKTELVLALPLHHPMAKYGSRDLTDIPRLSMTQLQQLSDVPFACYGERTFSGKLIRNFWRETNFSPVSIYYTDNAATMTSILESGLYAGFILKMKTRKIKNMAYFLPPKRITHYMAAGIFSIHHTPTKAERFIAYLHYLYMKEISLYEYAPNELMQEILREFSDYEYQSL